MIAVKIECDCGQRFAFDVEPVNGRMGSTVACPACGADGTAAANEIITQKIPPPPPPALVANPVAPAKVAPPKSAVFIKKAEPETTTASAHVPPAPSISVTDRQLGIVERPQAEAEARAKVSWGESEEDVIKYLMLQRFTVPEARELVAVMFKERMAAVRVNGIRKIVTGIGLMCVPVIAYAIFAHIGIIPIKLMGIALMVGLWGCWLLLNGIIALAVPKMESGDVAEQ